MTGILQVSQIQQLDGTPFSYAPRNITTFAASGIWTRPAWCNKVVVRVVGGGGGSCGYAESGGAGGYCELTISRPTATVAVTVGVGGAGVVYYAAGGYGATSSFGTYCSASGGGGANTVSSHTGGRGGVGVGGDINIRGGGGTGHDNVSSTAMAKGGNSYWGGSAGHNRNLITNLGIGSPGTGACGARADSTRGDVGMAGLVVVMEYN